jgi:hypothetical protein
VCLAPSTHHCGEANEKKAEKSFGVVTNTNGQSEVEALTASSFAKHQKQCPKNCWVRFRRSIFGTTSSFSRAKTKRFRLQNGNFIELSGPQSVYEMNPSEKVDTADRREGGKHCKDIKF